MFTAFYKTLLLWLKYQDKSFLTKFKNYLQEYFFLVLINLDKDPKKKERIVYQTCIFFLSLFTSSFGMLVLVYLFVPFGFELM